MKIKKTSIIGLMMLLFMFFSVGFNSSKGNVVVIPIEGEINKATYEFVKDQMSKIDPETTDAIIFEIDTYGGLVDQAINIKDLIIASPVSTISYINNKAISAGTLISIASDKVVMNSTSTIGSAETIPNSEKYLSMWRGVLRDTAQYRNKDALVMQAMADKDIEIAGVIESGKLLNLTSNEAKALGISDLTADSYEEILAAFNIKDAKITTISENLKVKLTKYISSPYVASFLLTLGFVGMVIEIFTPGFGFGGTISIVGFGLYFGGNILAGNSNWTALILFSIGLILAMIAMIVPGFGIPEVGGLVFILLGVVLAVDSVSTAILSLSIAIILTTIITVFIVKLGFKSNVLNRIVLDSNHTSEKGFLSRDSQDVYLNKEGIAQTELRPSGFIEIDQTRLDVLSDAGLISKGERVKVVRIEGSNIFVRRI